MAPPKTGSTWLSKLLIEQSHWTPAQLVQDFGRREQEIDIRKLISYSSSRNLISQHLHLKFSEPTLHILNQANIKVVLLHRDLLDCLRSVFDHLNTESTVFPMAYISEEKWRTLSLKEKKQFVIRHYVPWYLSFYNGWFENKERVYAGLLSVAYEDLLSDTVNELKAIGTFAGFENQTDQELQEVIEAVSKKPTRKNKARTGRGRDFFDQEELKEIRKTISLSNVCDIWGKLENV